MQPWTEFYAVIGAAGAALLGLLFVSVSINAAIVLGGAHSRGLAEQAFANYLVVMMVSLVALFPTVSARDFSTAVLAMTGLSSLWLVLRIASVFGKPHAGGVTVNALRRFFTSLVGFGLMIYAAIEMYLGDETHRSLFAAATMILLFSATTVSWELLIRTAKQETTGLEED